MADKKRGLARFVISILVFVLLVVAFFRMFPFIGYVMADSFKDVGGLKDILEALRALAFWGLLAGAPVVIWLIIMVIVKVTKLIIGE